MLSSSHVERRTTHSSDGVTFSSQFSNTFPKIVQHIPKYLGCHSSTHCHTRSIFGLSGPSFPRSQGQSRISRLLKLDRKAVGALSEVWSVSTLSYESLRSLFSGRPIRIVIRINSLWLSPVQSPTLSCSVLPQRYASTWVLQEDAGEHCKPMRSISCLVASLWRGALSGGLSGHVLNSRTCRRIDFFASVASSAVEMEANGGYGWNSRHKS
jgi:hypothetical protein